MQKKLLTLAVAGALGAPGLALAQSSVEVYGTINMALGHWKYDNGSVAGATQGVTKWDLANGASNYGLRGRESLGGGLTAWFQIEQNAPLERSANNAVRPASRNSAVGIQGAWGNVFVGQWTTPWADLDALWSVGTVGFWGPVTSVIGRRETTGTAPNVNTAAAPNELEAVGGVGHPFWRRINQSVFYQSPVWSGAQFKLGIQTNDTKSVVGGSAAAIASNASMWSASVTWSGMGGAARVGFAYDRHKDFTTINGTDTGWALKGGYNFGFADIGLAYENLTYECAAGLVNQGAAWNGVGGSCVATGDVKAKNWAIAAAVPVGTGAIRGSYARAKALSNSAITNATGPNTGSKVWNLGYEHRFSKRTNVGIGYAKIDNDADSAMTWTGVPPNGGGVTNGTGLGQDVRTVFVSITHRF